MASDLSHTPIYTPRVTNIPNGQTDDVLSSTTQTLNSLVSFYQQERMWVYRMRSTLQEACTPQLIDEGPDRPHQAHPTSTPNFSMEQEGQLVDEASSSTGPGETRWMRRKKEYNLRLKGIRSKRLKPPQFVREQPVEKLRHRELILEMFEKMMESRMESCKRVNKLVQEAIE